MSVEEQEYSVQASQELFDKFKSLRNSVMPLASIIQNDLTVKKSEIKEWNEEVKAVLEQIKTLRNEVLKHIEKCNGDD